MGSFAKETQAQVQEDAVVFVMETGGVPRRFEISGDVLRHYFGAGENADESTGSELLRAFETARDPLVALAKKAQWVPSEGVITLGEGDFSESGEPNPR